MGAGFQRAVFPRKDIFRAFESAVVSRCPALGAVTLRSSAIGRDSMRRGSPPFYSVPCESCAKDGSRIKGLQCRGATSRMGIA